MKAFEIVKESYDYAAHLKDEAGNMLVAAKANEIETIDINQFVDSLNSKGFSLTVDSAKELLKDITFVTVSGDTINVYGQDEETSTTFDNDPEQNKDVVSRMAQKAAKRGK